jgi:ATP-binding cassette subfamily B protein RaxB
VRQTEAAECGLACLVMIANYHGHNTDLGSLRLQNSISLKGSTLKSLIEIAGRLQFSARPLKVELDALDQLKTPCILHWKMNHFVVLRAISQNSCTVHDPALGVRHYSMDEVSSRFTGIALEFSPTGDLKPRRDKAAMRLTDLWSGIEGLTLTLAQTLILSLIVQLFVLVAPFYMQLVVDEVLTNYDTDLLPVLAIGFGMFMLINVTATALRRYVILYLGQTLVFQMVSNLFHHLLRLPLGWFDRRHIGDILSRFSSTRPIRDLFAEGLVASLIDGLMAISTLIVIFVYSSRLGGVVLAALVLYLGFRLALYRQLREKCEDMLVALAREQSTFIESVRGIQSIKLFGHEAERGSLWQNRYADVINSGVKAGKLGICFDTANGLLFGVENTLVVYLGALLVVDGSLTVGMLFAFMAYKTQFIDKARTLVERLIDFRMLDLHLERISDIGLARPERDISTTDGNLVNGGLALVDVSFRYGVGDPWLLKNASLEIDHGDMVVVVGPSGSGKTTLMKLLVGLFDPESGEVRYNGIALERFGHTAFRRRVGSVMQDDTLFAGSIAENISFFDAESDMDRLTQCARRASIHADIVAMPMGYNSLVGEMGSTLSAGQRQRILLARALYREPEILILDEGTANLDATTEARVVKVIRDLDITRICVAHRNAMVSVADRVILMRGGSLHEFDVHNERSQPL